jgi:hypothetical protein
MTFIDGIDYEAQKKDGQMANDLQTIFRTALRDIIRKGCVNEIEINAIVPDVKTMDFLKEKMEPHFEVNCQMIDGFIREKETFTRTEYMREYRKKRTIGLGTDH